MDTLNVSGLQQPSVNLGGLLSNQGMSGAPGDMSGGTLGTTGAGGMTGGMDLAELLQMLGQAQGEVDFIPRTGAIGSLPFSIAQQQQSGLGLGDLGQEYSIAGGGQQSPTLGQQMQVGSVNPSADPFAIIQKILGLSQKAVGVSGQGGRSLMPGSDMGAFDPTGQTQTEGFQSYRAGEREDLSGAGDPNAFLGDSWANYISQFSPQELEFVKSLQTSGMEDFLGDDFLASGGDDGAGLGGGMESLSGDTSSFGGITGGGVNFNPTVGNILGLLGGAAGIYGGIRQGNPYAIGAGALGTAGSAATMLGQSGLAGALGGVGGLYNLYQGTQTGDPFQILGGLGSAAQGASSLSGMLGGPTIGSLLASQGGSIAGAGAGTLGAGITAGTGTGGAAAAGGAGAGAGAGVGAGSAAAYGPIAGAAMIAAPLAVAALGPVFHSLFDTGGILGTDHKPTSEDISRQVAEAGIQGFNRAIAEPRDVSTLAAILNTPFSPHGEVQVGSGNFQGPLFQQALGALYQPQLVQQGLPWVEDFVRGLSVNYGPTGAANTGDAEAVWKLQTQFANALPDLPAYAGLKAAVGQGGDLWQQEQARMAQYQQYLGALGGGGQAINTYDPYTDTATPQSGTPFLLSPQTIANYGINPYTYDPALATYGPAQDPSSNSWY